MQWICAIRTRPKRLRTLVKRNERRMRRDLKPTIVSMHDCHLWRIASEILAALVLPYWANKYWGSGNSSMHVWSRNKGGTFKVVDKNQRQAAAHSDTRRDATPLRTGPTIFGQSTDRLCTGVYHNLAVFFGLLTRSRVGTTSASKLLSDRDSMR